MPQLKDSVNLEHIEDTEDVFESVNPSHYKGFSNGAQPIDIAEGLTHNAGAALCYIARSCRLDGENKGDTLEDLEKTLWYINREIARVKALRG